MKLPGNYRCDYQVTKSKNLKLQIFIFTNLMAFKAIRTELRALMTL